MANTRYLIFILLLFETAYCISGGNLATRIEENLSVGQTFSEAELKRLLRHVAMVSMHICVCVCVHRKVGMC